MRDYTAGNQIYANAKDGDFVQLIVAPGFTYGGWDEQDELLEWNKKIETYLVVFNEIEFCRKLPHSEIERIKNISFDYDADDFAALKGQKLSKKLGKKGIRHEVSWRVSTDRWWFDFEIIILRKRLDGSWSVVRSQGYDFLSTERQVGELVAEWRIEQKRENDEYERQRRNEEYQKEQVIKRGEERIRNEIFDEKRLFIFFAVLIVLVILARR